MFSFFSKKSIVFFFRALSHSAMREKSRIDATGAGWWSLSRFISRTAERRRLPRGQSQNTSETQRTREKERVSHTHGLAITCARTYIVRAYVRTAFLNVSTLRYYGIFHTTRPKTIRLSVDCHADGSRCRRCQREFRKHVNGQTNESCDGRTEGQTDGLLTSIGMGIFIFMPDSVHLNSRTTTKHA